MGMLVSGHWSEIDTELKGGRYSRAASTRSIADISRTASTLIAEPGRFILIASFSCPWSHRTTIMRTLKRLERLVPVHMAHGDRIQGYAINGGAPWPVPGTSASIEHLHELYTLDDGSYTGRTTVPVLWDTRTCTIVSNDSAQIMRLFDTANPQNGPSDVRFAPDAKKREIDALNETIHADVNNGVYRAGFAQSQAAYDEAVNAVFARFDDLEARLTDNRFLLGNLISEPDWRLFATLVRFDAIYYVLHRCCRRRLIDYPNLWAYARDLHAWDGIAQTIDLNAARTASFRNDTVNNPHGIVPLEPHMDWREAHGRERLGPIMIARREGKPEPHIPADVPSQAI